ncbi:MAG: membrane dipeptidase [Planctomycetota bacterium]
MPTPTALRAVFLLAASLLPAQGPPTFADVHYGPHERNTLDFWRATAPGRRPLLVRIHGGGWVVGDKANERQALAPFLFAGVHCAAIDYRRTDTDPLPAPVLDAARAVQFLRSKAEEWGIDTDHIALAGGSAGACTSMWLLFHDDLADPKSDDPIARQSTRVCAAFGNVGQTSIDPKVVENWVGPKILDHRMIFRAVGEPDRAAALANYDRHRALFVEYSPITHVNAGDPPLFMTYGKDATLPARDAGHGIHHPQLGVEMKKACDAAGVECHLVIPGVSTSPGYASAEEFLLAKLYPDPEQQLVARARAIHARTFTLDTHKDIDPKLAPETLPDDPATREEFRARFDPTVRGRAQVDFPKMREGGYGAAFFIVYTGQGKLDAGGFARALAEANAKFDAIWRMARLYPDDIGVALTADDAVKLHRAGKLVALIGIENGYPMGEDVARVEEFWRRGARYMGIAHNGHSQLGDSHTPAEPLHRGLSALGRAAIAEMNRVGIMVDISHTSRETMLQAVECSKAPVIASHSGARAVSDHSRNLDDAQLRALAAKGGVVQCVALGEFVKNDPARAEAVRALRTELGIGRRAADAPAPTADLETRMRKYEEGLRAIDAAHPPADVKDFVDHIDHVVRTVGIDHVGIGSDFDGGGGIVGWNDASETPNVTIELVRRGYTEEQIRQIWGGNLLRVLRAVEKFAADQKR